MIKIAHEAPLSLMPLVRQMTDYDYCLVHLLEESGGYFKFFRDSLKMGREVILDNSIFELGEAFDWDKYLYWIKILKPTYYIIPDFLEDQEKTLGYLERWLIKYHPYTLPSKPIAVVQGSTLEEAVKCYQVMSQNSLVDKIAIPFNRAFYLDLIPHPNKYVSYALGRVYFITHLLKNYLIKTTDRLHLLGASLPQEFFYYRNLDFIDSLDTSNPVVAGIKNVRYERYGLTTKISQKMVELFYIPIEEVDVELIKENIKSFKELM